MPYLTQLADVARRTGFPVTEVAGWASRGHGEQPYVQGVVAHHTAGATAGGDYPSLGVVRDGRTGLAGPLSHFGIGRSGRIYVIAAGRCWHNAPSTSSHHTNSNSVGIEAENDGRQPWPPVQLDAYVALCGELCKEFDLAPSRVKGHKEVNTQKPDPHSVDMGAFRDRVGAYVRGEAEEDPMPEHDRYTGRELDLILPPGEWRYLPYNEHNSQTLIEWDYSVAYGAAQFNACAGVRFASSGGEGYEPLEEGTLVQMRAVEVKRNTAGVFEPVELGPVNSLTVTNGSTQFTHTWNGNLQKDRRLRFRIAHFSSAPARLPHTTASVHTWPY